MELQQLTATSRDPECARRSVSWGDSIGEELDPTPALGAPAIDGSLRYPAAELLPDGILYAPPSMDFKWVIALRAGRLLVARSWTGGVEAVLDARRDGSELVLEHLRLAEASHLHRGARTLDVVDWLIRAHVWDQRLPLPVDDALADQLERVPTSGFGPFGKALFCAAKTWSPSPPSRPLRSNGAVIRAARRGDVAALRHAVGEGAAVDAPGIGGYTALLVAVVRRDEALFDALLKLGADPHATTDRGMHALGLAVVHDAPPSMFERIATTTLDLAMPNRDGFTALHAAAEVGRTHAVPWLVAHGVPLEARTKHGHTALHVACALGQVDAASALLDAGADVAAASPSGTPREVAAAEGKPALVALLDARRRGG
jgi:hypothetical protein